MKYNNDVQSYLEELIHLLNGSAFLCTPDCDEINISNVSGLNRAISLLYRKQDIPFDITYECLEDEDLIHSINQILFSLEFSSYEPNLGERHTIC